MKKIYTAIITCLLLLFFVADSFGQQALVSSVHKKALDDISVKKASDYKINHQKALSAAAAHKWVIRKGTKGGGAISLQGLNERGFPVYHTTNDNSNFISAATTKTNTLYPGGALGLNFTGSSTTLNGKLGEWDGGAVYAQHQEFGGKTITINTTVGIVEHSTHVAGTMIAKGVYPPARGMAYKAATLQSYDFDNDISTISGAASGLLLSNHSYGNTAGWLLDETGSNWTWYGLPGDTVDASFGIYDSYAQSIDNIEYNAPYYLIVTAAGNSRGYPGPDIGGTYQGYKSRTDPTLVTYTRTAAQNISSQQYYDGITDPSTAKNILAVAAVNALPYGPASGSDVSIAYFSSWGPTDDGRIKPDISGMGVDVLSTGIGTPQTYAVESGTSMASPNVCGSLYLLQEYYSKKHAGTFMLAATLKALACGTALDAGNAGPDYIYGWGLLDMQKAAQAITDNGKKSIIKEDTLQQGQTRVSTVTASGNGPLMATIAWTDPEGTPTADGTINSPAIKLVNDLDIRISDGTTTFKPWVLNPAAPGVAATTGDNIRDNIEQVYLANATPGKTYTITVSHKGTLQSGSQAFGMVVTGVGGSAYCTSGPTSSADSRINNVTISNINNTQTTGCTTYSDFTNLTATLEQGKTYPLSLTLGTCGGNFNKAAKVYIDWNENGTFTDAGDLVATTNVINGTGTYTTNVTVPLTVVPGNYSLMRVVLTETGDTSTIKPCGNYAKGETQDYRVLFSKTEIDAGVIGITSPDSSGACAGVTPITITLKNFGSAAITNVPVTVTIKAPDNTVTTLNETYTGTLAPLEQENFTLSGTYTALASSTYVITATSNLAGDVIAANNQYSVSITTNAAPVVDSLSVAYCMETSEYLLNGSGDGELLWYTSAASTTPIAIGASVETTTPPVNNTYYVGLNDFSGSVGPATKNVFTAGGYNQFGPFMQIHAAAPVIIESARLYVGNSGKITFAITNANGQTLSSTTISAVATRTTPGPGAQTDDPNDQGQVYNLNLLVPAAGDYTITVTFDDNATLYRNNGGVTGYPFTTGGGLFSITGNTASDGSNANYYKSFYYYFYDMQVRSAGCASAERKAVMFVKPTVTLTDNTLSSNIPSGNQWYLNGNIITGATSQTYSPLISGKYQTLVTYNTSCSDTSNIYNYTAPVKPGSIGDIGLNVYPIPTTDILNIVFGAKDNANLTMSLVNVAGKTVYSTSRSITAGNIKEVIDVSSQPPGVYVLKLLLGGKKYSTKVVVIR